MTMPSSIVVDSLEAGLHLVFTIATSLPACVNGRPKTFPKSPWDQGEELIIEPCHSTLVYTVGTQWPGLLPPDTNLRTPLQHTVGLWAGVRSRLLTTARPCPDSGFVCLEWPQWQTDNAGIFFVLWERAGFKGDICVKKLFSRQPLLRCPDRKGRAGEEWHVIKWTIKKFPNFWLQLTSELSPVPIFWLII